MVGHGIAAVWIAAASKIAYSEGVRHRLLPEGSRMGAQPAGFYNDREDHVQHRELDAASKPHSTAALPATSLFPRGFLPRGQSDSSPLKF